MNEFDEYQPYGDLSELNRRRDLLDTVGKETLERIAKGYLDLLDTSAAIYEADGSYATALFSSGYCRLMDGSSRGLCNASDNAAALASGKWLCHESCWTDASRISIETGKPYDLKGCQGGINLFAAPIIASGVVVGSINCGYGSPPSDDKTIDELVEKFKVDRWKLLEAASEYKVRPEYVVEAVKRQVLLSAELIGEIYTRNKLAAKLSRKEEKELSRTHRMLSALIDNVPDIAWIKDAEGRLVIVNEAFSRGCGIPVDELIGKTDFDCWPRELAERYRADDRAVMEEDLRKQVVDTYVDTNGRLHFTETIKTPFKNDDGVIIGTVGIARDVTERRRMEEELRLQGEIVTNMAEGVVLVRADDGTIVFANPEFNRASGYEEGGLMGKNISIIHAPTDVSPEVAAMQISSALKETGSWQGEVLQIKKDGALFWCHVVLSAFKHSAYGPVWVGIGRDITQRKEAEKRLWETGERLRAIIDNMPALVFLKDVEGKYLLINSLFEESNQISRTEVIGKTDYDISPREVADGCRKSDNDALTGLKPSQSIEDDGIHTYLAIKFPLFDANGKPYAVCGIATDITELKRNEEMLKSELALKTSIAKVTEALLNPELDKYDISKLVYEEALILTGSKYGCASVIDEETGDNVSEHLTDMPGVECRVTKDDPARFLSAPVLSGGRLIGQIALANPARDFNDRDLDIITRLAAIYAIALERKKMEEAVRKSEELFKNLAAVAPVGIFQADAGGRSLYVNERWCEITGITMEETLGDGWSKAVHPDDFGRVIKEWRLAVASNAGSFKSIHRFKNTNGKITWAYVQALAYRDKHGSPAGYIGAITDMTGQKGMMKLLDTPGSMPDISRDRLPGPRGGMPHITADSPLAELIDLRVMERIFLNFTDIVGISAAIIDLEGKVLVSTPWQRLCTGFHRVNEKTCAHCIESDTTLALSMQQGKKVAIYDCKNGLTDSATPIVVGGRHLANLFTGQFLRSEPDVEFFRRQAVEFGFDEAAYLDALREVPIVPEEKIEPILGFMDTFANMIASAAEEKLNLQEEVLKNLVQEQMLVQQSKMASMGEMIGAIAHQWRQPLSAIAMIITDLKDAYDYGEFNKEYLLGTVEKTMAQVKHMSGTIEDFRNFFKPGKEKVIFKLNTAVSEVIHLIFDQLTKAHIRIALDCKYDAVRTPGEGKYSGICACEPELTGYGYPNEFKQAILNILVNARDAVVRKRQRGAPTQKRSAEESGEILIELSRTNDTSILEITDSGGGIPAEILQRIFEPYFTTKEGEGTGIGLYMVKVIIEQHMGGAIRASNGSKGAVFTIELPIRA